MLPFNFKPETEQRLQQAALNTGKPLDLLIEEAVAQFVGKESKVTKTGAELLDELKQLNLSPEYGDMSLAPEDLARQLRGTSNQPRYA